jgi:hypothetical protein
MRRYAGDPYWTAARYASACTQCKRIVRRGERIFYYPKGRSVYCEQCGEGAAADFRAAAADEETYAGGYG